ncbi:sulfate transporter CysZ [Thalassotalea sp. HSM 43]|uniref:sulfate transporter CysZ n=2 Tax=unclassified Thalassotalea TaxID=2614972 RepID=UPI0010814CCC|nr:sulfate transporter CysZ [Thalassotalea sp. HSM 43]QBY05731.1 sulfate transporter CysZ [Thalassotalea sp. HSM 43]
MTRSIREPIAQGGAGYFFKGFELIKTPGIRRFVFVPLMVNLILFGVAFYYLTLYISDIIVDFEQWLGTDWSWLTMFVEPLLYVTALICFSFVFSTFANWLAAPFNGLLSEKIERHLSGHQLDDSGFADVIKDIPRTLSREWCKLKYYLPRAIGFFIVLWILPFFGQIIWFVFIAWMMAIQYCDYPFDNHKINFIDMRSKLSEHKGKCFGFGISVTIAAMIPIVNLIVMPVAICGATAMWVDYFQRDYVSG